MARDHRVPAGLEVLPERKVIAPPLPERRVVVEVDEAGHHDLVGRVDHRRPVGRHRVARDARRSGRPR